MICACAWGVRATLSWSRNLASCPSSLLILSSYLRPVAAQPPRSPAHHVRQARCRDARRGCAFHKRTRARVHARKQPAAHPSVLVVMRVVVSSSVGAGAWAALVPKMRFIGYAAEGPEQRATRFTEGAAGGQAARGAPHARCSNTRALLQCRWLSGGVESQRRPSAPSCARPGAQLLRAVGRAPTSPAARTRAPGTAAHRTAPGRSRRWQRARWTASSGGTRSGTRTALSHRQQHLCRRLKQCGCSLLSTSSCA